MQTKENRNRNWQWDIALRKMFHSDKERMRAVSRPKQLQTWALFYRKRHNSWLQITRKKENSCHVLLFTLGICVAKAKDCDHFH